MIATMTLPVAHAAARAMLIEELSREEGKAEIIKGRVVKMSPANIRHNRAAGKIYYNIMTYENQIGGGYAVGDNATFLVNLPDRYSFSPDVAWHIGSLPLKGDCPVDGAPVFAVEVRSLSSYSPAGERAILEKVREYFAAGTRVVWDVDYLHDGWIKKYTPETIDNPHSFKRGEIADAEPAVPNWRMAVNDLF